MNRTFRTLCAGAFAWLCLLSMPAMAQQGPLPVDVATPLVTTIVDWDEFTGRFEAVERVDIRARVAGYLDKVLFRDGQLVEKDDLLFVIDPRPFEAEHERAAAELEAAIAEQTRAKSELERGEQLVRNRTVAEATLDVRIAAKLRADAQVAVARAAMRTTALNLEFTEIRAPFTGRISESRSDVGNLVNSGDTVLATLVTTDPIHLVFTSSEADFLKYTRLSIAGDRPSSRSAPNAVEAQLIDEQDWAHTGAMDFVANEFDPNSGTITGRALFENPDGVLTPGLFARLRLIGSGEYEAMLIPDTAVLSDQTRKVVMVVGDDNIVSPRVVELGRRFRGLRVIRSGIMPEDRVVVLGVLRARPGGEVVPQDTVITFPDQIN